jgi:DNA-binding response OmpR family regulator
VRVWYDPDLLDKCLFNILSNAFKFTPDGGKVSLDIREDEGGRVYITVSDTGVGMDKDTLQRVFERFYQGNSKQLTAGSGIGMHLAKSIAELHGGNITASSEMDKGSSFCLLILPGNSHFAVEQMALEDGFHRVEEKEATDKEATGANAQEVTTGAQRVSDTQKTTNEKQATGVQGAQDEQEATVMQNGSTVTKQQQVQGASDTKKTTNEKQATEVPGAPNEQKASEEQDNTVGKKLTILVVEDDEDIRKYIRKELESRYQVEEAVNGALGLSKAKKILPDLVITDVMMPEMTGTELCKRLKTDAETCHIPVIILTAQSDLEHRIEGLETGADSYIPKPFNVKHLNVRIEKLIALRQTLKERFSKSLNMEAQEVTLTSTDERLLQHAIDYIRENMEDPELSVENMSKALGMSRTHLHRKLKALTNQSPIEFIKVIRMKQAAYLLSTGKLSVSEVGYKVGYNTPSYFSSSFNAHFGMSPTAYMEQRGNSNGNEEKEVKR